MDLEDARLLVEWVNGDVDGARNAIDGRVEIGDVAVVLQLDLHLFEHRL